jgi:hypothetical protein
MLRSRSNLGTWVSKQRRWWALASLRTPSTQSTVALRTAVANAPVAHARLGPSRS